jgi:hypothetical protein
MGSIPRLGFIVLIAALLAECSSPPPAGSTPPPSDANAGSWDELRTRPLNLPTAAQGQPCPVSPSTRPLEDGPLLRGSGPVYNAAISVPAGTPYKIAFFASSSYTGPVLVRGRQLDGPNRLLFDMQHGAGQALTPALMFKWPTGNEAPLFAEMDLMKSSSTIGGLPAGWRFWPSFTYAPTRGCFAWQVDGATFSQAIVFEAK